MTIIETNVTLEPEFEELAVRLAHVVSERKDLEAIEKKLKEQLRKTLKAGETGLAADGRPLVRAKRVARWDSNLAAQILPGLIPDEVLASLKVATIDATKAKQILAPAIAELCTREYDPAIEVV